MISALDIEKEMLDLDYISEAMVVSVEDRECGQRLAAAVVLRSEVNHYSKKLVSCSEKILLTSFRIVGPSQLPDFEKI